MSDPGTTYRTRDEIQQMRSEKDAIAGLKKYILEWGVTDESSLKVLGPIPTHGSHPLTNGTDHRQAGKGRSGCGGGRSQEESLPGPQRLLDRYLRELERHHWAGLEC